MKKSKVEKNRPSLGPIFTGSMAQQWLLPDPMVASPSLCNRSRQSDHPIYGLQCRYHPHWKAGYIEVVLREGIMLDEVEIKERKRSIEVSHISPIKCVRSVSVNSPKPRVATFQKVWNQSRSWRFLYRCGHWYQTDWDVGISGSLRTDYQRKICPM